jgi:2-oxopent-4-enoate/cis-2-oxohex-4-enoate hydratase
MDKALIKTTATSSTKPSSSANRYALTERTPTSPSRTPTRSSSDDPADSPGERVVGKKIGVTSKVVMDMLKVNQPDFGWLLRHGLQRRRGHPRQHPDPAQGRRRDRLPDEEGPDGPGLTAADILAATEG